MKSLKTIIIAGAVLIVFIIASLVVTHLPSGSGDTTAQSVTQEESSSSAETAYIINRDYDSLERFTIVPTERKVDEDTGYAYASEELDVKISRSTDEKGAEVYSYDVSPDPGFTLTSTASCNYTRYRSNDMNDLITQLRKSYTADSYQSAMRLIQDQFEQDQPYICLYWRSAVLLSRETFTDVRDVRELEMLRGIENYGN